MTAIKGSCLCGGIAFEITGPMEWPLNCHCEQCRKQHGAAFRSRVRVRVENVNWIKGEDLLKYYESSPGFRRGFCGNCGTPVANRPGPGYKLLELNPDAVNELGIPLGILDDDPGVQPAFHIFTRSKAPWFEITDDLPQHEILPKPT